MIRKPVVIPGVLVKEIAPYGPLASNCTSWIGNFIFKICRLITIVFFHTLRSQNVNLINNLEFLTQQKSQQDSKIGTFLVHPSQNHLICPPKLYHPLTPPSQKGWNGTTILQNRPSGRQETTSTATHLPRSESKISAHAVTFGDHDGWMTWGG